MSSVHNSEAPPTFCTALSLPKSTKRTLDSEWSRSVGVRGAVSRCPVTHPWHIITVGDRSIDGELGAPALQPGPFDQEVPGFVGIVVPRSPLQLYRFVGQAIAQ
jgi:hypothetical protein